MHQTDSTYQVTVDDVVDRLRIDDLLTRYAHAIDANDWELMASCFTADAVWDLSKCGGVRGSAAEVIAWLAPSLEGWTINQHFLVNRDIRVSGDEATGHCYYWNVMGRAGADGTQFLRAGGFFHDRYRRTDKGWRIAERDEDLTWFDGAWPDGVRTPG